MFHSPGLATHAGRQIRYFFFPTSTPLRVAADTKELSEQGWTQWAAGRLTEPDKSSLNPLACAEPLMSPTATGRYALVPDTHCMPC
jgi:hypothetical protein